MSFYIYETTVGKETPAQRLVNHLDTNAKDYYAPLIAVEKEGDVEVNVLDAEQIRARNAVAIAFVKSYRNSGPIPHPTLKEQLDIVIEQAERAQELEKDKMRLRRALKHITVFPTHFSHEQHSKRALKIARKALRGVSNDQTNQT